MVQKLELSGASVRWTIRMRNKNWARLLSFLSSLKKKAAAIFIRKRLKGAKSFALWPLSQAAQACFGKDTWPDNIPAPHAWLEFDVDSVEEQPRCLNHEDIGCSSRTRKNRGAKP